MFYHMKTGQEFAIARNYPFSDQQLADMRISKILTTQ